MDVRVQILALRDSLYGACFLSGNHSEPSGKAMDSSYSADERCFDSPEMAAEN